MTRPVAIRHIFPHLVYISWSLVFLIFFLLSHFFEDRSLSFSVFLFLYFSLFSLFYFPPSPTFVFDFLPPSSVVYFFYYSRRFVSLPVHADANHTTKLYTPGKNFFLKKRELQAKMKNSV